MSDLTLEQAHHQFETFLTAANRSPRTIRSYLTDLQQFIDWLHENSVLEQVDLIRKIDVVEFLEYLSESGLTGTTRARKLSSLRTFFNFAEEEGLLVNNPTTGVKTPAQEKTQAQVLLKPEYRALLHAAGSNVRNTAIIQTMLQTGIRVSELCHLRLSDVDLEGKRLWVRQGKGRKDREIPLETNAVEALTIYLAVRPEAETDKVFLSKSNRPLDERSVRYLVKSLAKKAGIKRPVSPHTLRHTFSAHKANKGWSVIQLQYMLGHENLETTYRYLHLVNPSLQDLMEKTSL
jgi:site-specific recombinase XerD